MRQSICRFAIALLMLIGAREGLCARAPIESVVKTPYAGAIVVDAATGDVLFEDSADAAAYPASVLKLMDLLVILEKIQRGEVRLDETVRVTGEAARMGGSQVFLKEGEVFTVDELLYALMVQSGNDAALALALHVGGTKEAFIGLMNKRAAELGMSASAFHSVHGLPPGEGQGVDVSTPRDMAKLCVELLKHPDTLRYSSTVRREFRPGTPSPFVMENHNRLLGVLEGCDGLKTGYFKLAGYSSAVTAARAAGRVVAVIMGSPDRKIRDDKARELVTAGLQVLASRPKPAPAPAPATIEPPPEATQPPAPKKTRHVIRWIVAVVLVAGGIAIYRRLQMP